VPGPTVPGPTVPGPAVDDDPILTRPERPGS
jgi:hypothetical protein